MVGIRNVREAIRQRVSSVNKNKKPRHVDNGILAISYTYRIKDHKNVRWLTTGSLRETLEDVYYTSSETLGPYFGRSFDKSLPDLARADMIRCNPHNRTQFRPTRKLTKLLARIANAVDNLDEMDATERHYAHCDYIRQKIGKFRPTMKAMIEELEELRESNEIWNRHAKLCTLDTERPNITRGMSVSSDASIFDCRAQSFELDNDVLMDSDQRSVLEMPQSSESTPPRRRSPANSVDAYPTPESLPRTREYTNCPPSTPSPLFNHASSFDDPDVTLTNDMDVDESTVAGPSSASSTDVEAEPHSQKEMAVQNEQFKADMTRVAQLVQADSSTLQSIEKAYTQKIGDLQNELSRIYYSVNVLLDSERDSALKHNEELESASLKHAQLTQEYEEAKNHLEEAEVMAHVLMLDAQDKYNTLKKAAHEQRRRHEQSLEEWNQLLSL